MNFGLIFSHTHTPAQVLIGNKTSNSEQITKLSEKMTNFFFRVGLKFEQTAFTHRHTRAQSHTGTIEREKRRGVWNGQICRAN